MRRGAGRFEGTGVAVTFDDGPHPDVTPRILEALADADAVASFFMVGDAALAYPELARAVVDAGHTVGNHTQTHRNLRLAPPWRVRDEIRRCQESLTEVTGVTPRVFRAPWGQLTRTAWRTSAELGLEVYDWTIAPEGWPKPLAPGDMVTVALDGIEPGAIVDLHDVPWHDDAGARTVEALPRILEGLVSRGLRTVPLGGAPARSAGPVD